MPELPKRKKCKSCGRTRLIKFFNKNCQAKDGIRIYCKDCQKKQSKNYYSQNKEQVLERTRAHKAENKEYYNEYFAKYREENREGLLIQHRDYYQQNRDKVLKRTKEWSKNNRDKRAVIDHRRRAKKWNQLGKVSQDIEKILWKLQDGKCYYCDASLLETGHHQEHKIPIARGGLHDDKNICLSCPQCNFRKGSKTEKEFCSLGGV